MCPNEAFWILCQPQKSYIEIDIAKSKVLSALAFTTTAILAFLHKHYTFLCLLPSESPCNCPTFFVKPFEPPCIIFCLDFYEAPSRRILQGVVHSTHLHCQMTMTRAKLYDKARGQFIGGKKIRMLHYRDKF